MTGSVFYRERVALPDAALIIVRLSKGEGAEFVSELVQTGDGRQVPIPFSIDSPDEAGTYVLTAEIVVDGKIVFATPQPVPVSGETHDCALLVTSLA